MRRLLFFTILGLALAAPASASAACRNTGVRLTSHNIRAVEHTTLCLVNAERRRRGLSALRSNSHLAAAARAHSRDMARRRYFSHASKGGGDFAARIHSGGYAGATLGENIAWGGGDAGTPRSIMRTWMRSPGHRANILRPSFREIGVGVARGTPVSGTSGGGVYTTDFGARF